MFQKLTAIKIENYQFYLSTQLHMLNPNNDVDKMFVEPQWNPHQPTHKEGFKFMGKTLSLLLVLLHLLVAKTDKMSTLCPNWNSSIHLADS